MRLPRENSRKVHRRNFAVFGKLLADAIEEILIEI